MDKSQKVAKKVNNATDIQKLVKKLDAVFSQYVRLKNADKNLMVKCFITGKLYHWKEIQNGHFMSRRHYATRWSLLNCKPQSVASNIFSQGDQIVFGQKIDELHGTGTSLLLQQQAQNSYKLDAFVLQHLIKEYTDKLKERKAELGIL